MQEQPQAGKESKGAAARHNHREGLVRKNASYSEHITPTYIFVMIVWDQRCLSDQLCLRGHINRNHIFSTSSLEVVESRPAVFGSLFFAPNMPSSLEVGEPRPVISGAVSASLMPNTPFSNV